MDFNVKDTSVSGVSLYLLGTEMIGLADLRKYVQYIHSQLLDSQPTQSNLITDEICALSMELKTLCGFVILVSRWSVTLRSQADSSQLTRNKAAHLIYHAAHLGIIEAEVRYARQSGLQSLLHQYRELASDLYTCSNTDLLQMEHQIG